MVSSSTKIRRDTTSISEALTRHAAWEFCAETQPHGPGGDTLPRFALAGQTRTGRSPAHRFGRRAPTAVVPSPYAAQPRRHGGYGRRLVRARRGSAPPGDSGGSPAAHVRRT